jgi:hypothetical protein
MTEDTSTAVEQVEAPVEYKPGEITACDVFASPKWTDQAGSENSLTILEKNTLKALVSECSKDDPTARIVQVEQSWESRLFLKGYQHLLPRRGGGWALPGDARFSVNVASNEAGLLSTNIYGQEHDILTAALSCDPPRVQFFPKNSDKGPDVTAADAANKFKYCWSKANDWGSKVTEISSYLYTDGQAMLFTRSVADQRFGRVSGEEGVVPEDEMDAAFSDTAQDTAQDTALDPAKANDQGDPRIMSVTSVFGTLEIKTPISVNHLTDMQYAQLSCEVDVAIAKSRYPWVADKIKASGENTGGGDDLARTARRNVKLAVPGIYVTGDTTITYTFIRPSMFMDDKAKVCRDSFMTKFPKGVLVITAGTEFACAYSVSMDDHLTLLHSSPGNGQNRRALGSSIIPVQKRLNKWLDLYDDYMVKGVPHKYYDSETFDMEAIQLQKNTPGAAHPFTRQPGVAFTELMGTDPQVEAPPALFQGIQFFAGPLAEQLSGALPSIFGGDINSNTVGAAKIQRDAALQRLGVPWKAIKSVTASACQQAVICAAENGNDSVSDTVMGQGRITVEMEDLKGNVLCFPEADSDFPESWTQRESRFTELVTLGQTNDFVKAILAQPKNAKIAKDAMRMSELEIPGATSVEKQQAEFEVLLKSGPVPNPQVQQIQDQITKGQQVVSADAAQGIPVQPEVQAMLQQLTQQAQALPPTVSTVPPRQDESEDHAVEASVCWDWMNSSEGRTYYNGDEQQRDAFDNVHSHWTEHTALAKKLTAPAPPPPPKVSVTFQGNELPPNGQAQLLGEYGMQVTPQDFQQGQVHEQSKEIEQTTPQGTVKQKTSVSGAPLS